MSRFLSNLWKRKDYLDKRIRHQDVDDICGGLSSGGFTMSGIYLIGCGDRIVYIGQSIGMGGIAEVFTDVDYPCAAFESDNLEKQAIEAKNNQSPP